MIAHSFRRSAFTLLEVLLALGLTVTLISIMWVSIDSFRALQERATAQTSESQLLRGLYVQFRDDLAAAETPVTVGNRGESGSSSQPPVTEANSAPPGLASPVLLRPTNVLSLAPSPGAAPANQPLAANTGMMTPNSVAGIVGDESWMIVDFRLPQGFPHPHVTVPAENLDLGDNLIGRDIDTRDDLLSSPSDSGQYGLAPLDAATSNGVQSSQVSSIRRAVYWCPPPSTAEFPEVAEPLFAGLRRVSSSLRTAPTVDALQDFFTAQLLSSDSDTDTSQFPPMSIPTLMGPDSMGLDTTDSGWNDETLVASWLFEQAQTADHRDDPIPEVTWCRFRYRHDSSWRGQWDSRRDGLPSAVAIEFILERDVKTRKLDPLDEGFSDPTAPVDDLSTDSSLAGGTLPGAYDGYRPRPQVTVAGQSQDTRQDATTAATTTFAEPVENVSIATRRFVIQVGTYLGRAPDTASDSATIGSAPSLPSPADDLRGDAS
ncbi:MAG: hypothetical protein KDA60_00350 [Planctomycetales bacterium]|nr:hypothetical protein [Planctomycetales bacterium]